MNSEDYKKNLLASGLQNTEDLTLPSGNVFKMRPAPIREWVAVGILPASLATKMMAVARSQNGDRDAMATQILNSFSEQDFLNQQQLSKKLLEYCCVEPKVRLVPGPDETDALSAEEIDPKDLAALMEWAWSGGKAARELHTFRGESGPNAVAGADSQ